MTIPVILASSSSIRARLLTNAGVPFAVESPRVDEDSVKQALSHENAPPRDIADALAELKACKVSDKHPQAMVIGCDQVLDFDDGLMSKPARPEDAADQLRMLRGKTHRLHSAVVVCEAGRPVWRFVGRVTLRMRAVSDGYIDGYVLRNWDSIRDSVGSYKLEEEGVRLFSAIDGDYFTVLGMPLLELLDYMTLRGVLEK